MTINTINNDLIPKLNDKWRSRTLISSIARIIVDTTLRDNIKADELNLDAIESEMWREYIKRQVEQ